MANILSISESGDLASARPGEISLAHRGILFLNEFSEYTRSTIEALRQPLDDKVMTIAGAKLNANTLPTLC